jgi:hypothetical protein
MKSDPSHLRFVSAGCYALSIGWTTSPTSPSADQPHVYLPQNIDEGLQSCRRANLKNVTFPIRISMARQSADQLDRLLAADPTYTLTLWKGKEGVSEEDLAWLIEHFDPNRIFLDV